MMGNLHCSRRRLQKLCLLVSASLLSLVVLSMVALQDLMSRRCSETLNSQIIVDLCSLYNKNEIAGNMCHKLCRENAFRFDQCGNNHVGKYVLVMECDGCDGDRRSSKVVIKSKWDKTWWDSNIKTFFNDSSETFETMKQRTLNHINKSMTYLYGIGLNFDDDVISRVWRQDFESHMKSSSYDDADKVALKSIYSLGTQVEYQSMLVMRNDAYLPKLYGTCGPAYFVENTPSLSKLNYILFQGKIPEVLNLDFSLRSWNERADIALKLLDLVEELDTSYDRPLHFCDTKTHNIGLNAKQEVTLLDSDSLRFEGSFPRRTCSEDEHCRELNCHKSCDLETNVCLSNRTNSNIQSMCRNIFISGVETLGLLRFPPTSVQRDLKQTIRRCASDLDPNHSNRLIHDLRILLQKSLN